MHFLGGDTGGQTPLDADEAEGLIPSWVTTRDDLNLVEQENIARAAVLSRRRPVTEEILSEGFIRHLHKRMFGDVWRWAGTYRETNKNIGIDHWYIVEQLGQLLGNVRYWVENETYARDELAVRFHHCLVAIHPFPNGNGRVSRELADLLVVALGGEPFSWGNQLAREEPARARDVYIEALRTADAGAIDALVVFARS